MTGMPGTKHLCDRTFVFCRLDAFEERILVSEDSGFNTNLSGSGLFGSTFLVAIELVHVVSLMGDES
jgi:hypothetical protein